VSQGGDYKQLLQDHLELQSRYTLLQRVLHLFGKPDAFEEVFDGLMDALMDHFHAQAGSIYMHDSEQDELYFAAARGPKAQELLDLDITIKPGQGIAGSCFKHNEVIALSDAHKDARFAKEISEKVGYEVRSMLTAPVVLDGQPLGVLQVLNKKGASEFHASEVELAKQLGRYVGGLLGLGLHLRELKEALLEDEQPASAGG
jgi:GAF domain-containing protein